MFGSVRGAWMRQVAHRMVYLTAAASVLACAMTAQAQVVSAEVLRDRHQSAQDVLNRDAPEFVAEMRQSCASGATASGVARIRGRGPDAIWQRTPDASDMCPNALARVAKDGGLQALYTTLVNELSGDAATVATLPAAIGAATKTGQTVVPVGNQRGAKLTSALALDAGFTVAYQAGTKAASAMPDLAALKPIAERCLAQSESNLALCYSAGFVYGARAVSQLPLVQ